MKKLTLILMTVLLIATGVMTGCTSGKSEEEKLLEELAKEPSISGTYVCTKGGEEGLGSTVGNYYEFDSDGTFYLGSSKGGGGVGEWKLEGDGVTFTAQSFGTNIAWKGKIKDNTIVLDDGSTWVKEGKRVKEETTTPAPAPSPTPATSTATLEVANFDLSELIELQKAIEEVVITARLIANEEERRLLNQAEVVLGAIQPDSKLHDILSEQTEEERFILDVLGGIFSVGVQAFYNIPSPVAWAMTKGAEELGKQIAEWQVLGHLGVATVTQSDSGVMEIVYYKEQGEVWVNFGIYDPVGQVCMYILVEPRLISPEGGGNIILSEGVRPVMEKCRIAYHLDEVSTLAPTPTLPPKPSPKEKSTVWMKTFGGPKSDGASSVQQTSDGGYIIVGSTQSYGAGESDIWLIKIDADGNKQWDRTFGGTTFDSIGTDGSLQQTSEGGYIIVGSTQSYGAGESDIWLIKIDADGNKQWDRTFGGPEGEYGKSVQQTTDGGYVIAGESFISETTDFNIWLIKVDRNGNKQWDRTFGGVDYESVNSVQLTQDGGYILVGHTCSYGAGIYDVWCVFQSKSAGVPEQTGHHSGANRPPFRSKSATPGVRSGAG